MLSKSQYKPIPLSTPEELNPAILIPAKGADAKSDFDLFEIGIKRRDQLSQISRSLNNATAGKLVQEYFQKNNAALYPDQDITAVDQVGFLTHLHRSGSVIDTHNNMPIDNAEPFEVDTLNKLQPWVKYFLLDSPFDESGQLQEWIKKLFPEKNISAITDSLHKVMAWSYEAIYDNHQQFQSWVKEFYSERLLQQAINKIGSTTLRSHLLGAALQCLMGQYIKNKETHKIFAAMMGSIIAAQNRVMEQCTEQFNKLEEHLIQNAYKESPAPYYAHALLAYNEAKKVFISFLKNPTDAGKIPLLTRYLYLTISVLDNPNDKKAQEELKKFVIEEIDTQVMTWKTLAGSVTALTGIAVLSASATATFGLSAGLGYVGGSILTASGLALFKSSVSNPEDDEKHYAVKLQK